MTKFALMAVVALLVVGFAVMQIGASWSVKTTVDNTNAFKSGKLDIGISNVAGYTGSEKTVSAVWQSPVTWAPGDEPVTGKLYLHNSGNIPVNIVWSGFAVSGDTILAQNICVTDVSDSKNTTHMSDFASFVDSAAGCVTLNSIAGAFANGYFSDPNGVQNSTSVFIPVGETVEISMTLAFRAGAGNETMDKTVGFKWDLTAMQLPKNANP